MSSSLSFIFSVFVSLALVACGGDSSSSGNFTVNQKKFEFTAAQYGATPFDQELEVSWSDDSIAGFAFVFTEKNPQPDWLDFSFVEDDTSPAVIDLEITTTSLEPGIYEATLPLFSGDIDANPLSHTDIHVTYVVTQGAATDGAPGASGTQNTLTADLSELQFTGYVASGNLSQEVILSSTQSDSLEWESSTNQTWLSVDSETGKTPSRPVISVDTSASELASGFGSGVVRFTANGKSVTISVRVSLETIGLSSSRSRLDFKGIHGLDVASMPFSLNTLPISVAIPWTATTDQPWLSLDKLSGTTGTDINVSVDAVGSSLEPGRHSGNIKISSGRGDLWIPVTLELAPVTLKSSVSSLYFDGVFGTTLESKTVSLSTMPTGVETSWTAIAREDWLVLDKYSGSTDSMISVSINPELAELAPGSYNGTIFISSDRGDREVSVGLFLESPQLTLSTTNTTLAGLNGADIPTKSVLLSTRQNVATDWQVSTNASWVKVDMDSGTTPSTITVSVDPDNYPFTGGRYPANLIFSSAYSTITLRATLDLDTVTPKLSVSSLLFKGINGTHLTSQEVEVNSFQSAAGLPWVASSNVDWLHIDKAEGVIPESISVSVDPETTRLASGIYRGEVTVSMKGVSKVLDVIMSLEKPELSIPTNLLIGGQDGLSGQTSETLTLSLNTGDRSHPWSITEDSEWLTISEETGLVNGEGATTTFDIDAELLTPGTYTTEATATAVVNGDTLSKTLEITYNLEQKKLFIADNGVALVDLPSYSSLSHSVDVKDSEGETVAWQASTNQDWLVVTASGDAGDLLEFTADTTNLTAGQFYLAEVAVTAQDEELLNTEVIRVGLWVNDVSPVDKIEVSTNYKHIEADPVRPRVYANNGDGDIDVYNIYSGLIVDSINLGSITLADMAASTDGKFLYAVNGSASSIVRVDLDSLEYESFSVADVNVSTLLEYGRISATGYLYLSKTRILNAKSMEAVNQIDSLAPAYRDTGVIDISKNGNKVCHLNQGVSPYSLYCANVKETALGPRGVKYTHLIEIRGNGGNARDLALNHDGSRVFVASGSPYSFSGYELTDTSGVFYQSLPGEAYPNNVEMGEDGTLYAAASVWYGSAGGRPDYWEYNWRTGEKYSSDYLSDYAENILSRQLVVSGDNHRAMILTDEDNVKLIIRSTRLVD